MHNDPIIYKPLSEGWHQDDTNPSMVNSVPDLIGRIQGNDVDMESVRSDTDHLVSVSVPFDGAAIGVATVRVFQSAGIGDDAGLVIRITNDNLASAFQPYAELIPDGVDFHIAGDTESKAILEAIQQAATQALLKLQQRSQQPIQVPISHGPSRPSSLGSLLRSMIKFNPVAHPGRGKH